MKKTNLLLSIGLLIAIGVTAFQPAILASMPFMLAAENFSSANAIGIAHAKNEPALQQFSTPLPNVNEQEIVALVQTQAAQSNLQLSEAELQNIVQRVLSQLPSGAAQSAVNLNPQQLFPTRTPRPVEVRQTQDSIVMTQTYQAALSQLQPASEDDFEGAYIYSYGSLIGKKYIITIQLKNEVKGKYYAKMSDKFVEHRYKCTTTVTYPNRLYCHGSSIRGGQRSIFVYEEGTDKLVFIGNLILPRWTPTVVWPSPCPCCKDCD